MMKQKHYNLFLKIDNHSNEYLFKFIYYEHLLKDIFKYLKII